MGRCDSIIADQRAVTNFVISTRTLGRMAAAASFRLGRCLTLLLRGGRDTGATNSKASKRAEPLLRALDLHGSAVSQHLRNTVHHFGGVIAHGHNGVGP